MRLLKYVVGKNANHETILRRVVQLSNGTSVASSSILIFKNYQRPTVTRKDFPTAKIFQISLRQSSSSCNTILLGLQNVELIWRRQSPSYQHQDPCQFKQQFNDRSLSECIVRTETYL
jgi:hypothetical protein